MNIQSGVITTAVTLPKIAGLTTYSIDSSTANVSVDGLYIRNGGSLTIANGNTISGTYNNSPPYGTISSGYSLYVDDDGTGGTLKDDGTGGVTFTNGVYIYNGATVSLSGDTFATTAQNAGHYFVGVDVAAQDVNSLVNDTFPSGATMNIQSGVITTAVTLPKIAGLTTYSIDSSTANVSVDGLYIRNGGSLTIANGNTISGTYNSSPPYGTISSGYSLYVDDNGTGGTLKDDGTGGVTFTNGVYIYNGATVSLSGDTFATTAQNAGHYFVGVNIAAQYVNSLVNDTFPSGATMNIQSGVITTAVTLPKIAGLTTYSIDYSTTNVSVDGLHVRNDGSLTIASGNTLSGTYNSSAPYGTISSGYSLYVDDDGTNATLKDDGTGGVTFTNGVYIYNGATVSLSGDTFATTAENAGYYFVGVNIAAQCVNSLINDTFPSGATMNIQSGVITTAVTLPKIAGLTTYSIDYSTTNVSVDGLHIRNDGSLTIASGNTISGTYNSSLGGVINGGYQLYVDDDGTNGTLKDDGTGGVTFANGVYIYNGATVSLSGDTFANTGENSHLDFVGVDIAAQEVDYLAGDRFQGSNATMDIQSGVISTAVTFPKISGFANYSLDSGGLKIENGGGLAIACGYTISGATLEVSDNGSGGALWAEDVTFSNQLTFGQYCAGTVEFDNFEYSGPNYFDGQMAATVTDNNFNFSGSIARAQGSGGPVNLGGNYWGTTVVATIRQNHIYDHSNDSSLPVINLGTPLAAAPVFAEHLAFIVEPTDTAAGATVAPAVQVAVEDQNGNIVASDNSSVTLAIGTNPGGGALSGTTTAAAVQGVATFSNLSISEPGTGYTLTAADGSVTAAASVAFKVTGVGAPSNVVFTTGPSSTAAGAGISPAVQVSVEDASGNVVTSDGSNMTIAIGADPGGGSLHGTLTEPAINGVATFNDLWIDKAGAAYTLTAADGSLTGATSSSFNVTPAAASKLVFATQPSSTTAGVAMGPAVTVDVEDQYDNVVTTDGSTVTLTLSSGTFAGGSNTATAQASGGVAAFSNLVIDKTGSYTVAGTDGTLAATGNSNSFSINPAAAGKLVFGQQPTNATAGVAITPAVTVDVEDQYNNVVTTDGSTVTLTLSSGTFAGGSNTATAHASGGVATFSNLVVNKVGAGYTLTAVDGSLTGATSSTFNVAPAAASKVVLTTQPSSTTAGVAISPAVTVDVEDQYNNVVITDGSTVTLTLSSGTFAGGSNTAATQASAGVATFNNLVIDKTGSYTVAGTDGTLTATGNSSSFSIKPAAAGKLVFGQQPTNATAGVAISPAVTADVEDQYNNVVITDGSTVTLTLSSGTFAGGSNTATTQASGGVAAFSNLVIGKAGTGYTLTAADGSLSGATSSTFNVTPAAASKVIFATQPSSTTAGVAISPAVTVDVEDQYNNVVTTNGSTVTLALSSGTFASGSNTATAQGLGRRGNVQQPGDRQDGQLHGGGHGRDVDRDGQQRQLQHQPGGGQQTGFRPAAHECHGGRGDQPLGNRERGGPIQQRRHYGRLQRDRGHWHGPQRRNTFRDSQQGGCRWSSDVRRPVDQQGRQRVHPDGRGRQPEQRHLERVQCHPGRSHAQLVHPGEHQLWHGPERHATERHGLRAGELQLQPRHRDRLAGRAQPDPFRHLHPSGYDRLHHGHRQCVDHCPTARRRRLRPSAR